MLGQEPLYVMPRGVQTRWSSAENWEGAKGAACRGTDSRKRNPSFVLKAGETRTLAQASGTSGTVRRIWITIPDRTPKFLRGLKLDMYWDGAAKPAVSVPLGDFFMHGIGRMATFQNALFSSPEGRSSNCCIPMPFRSGMKIVVTNEAGADVGLFFFDVDYTLGDAHGPDTPYFHACWRRENPTAMRRDYELLPKVTGRGRFLGVSVGVIADRGQWLRTWWGEGEVKVFLDGDSDHPTLCGTGTEDYIGTGWGQGQYATLYQGCQLADHDKYQYCFYRLHVPDPIYFQQDIRVTIQQIGCWSPDSIAQLHGLGKKLVMGDSAVDMVKAVADHGYGLFERTDDWSSCAYFYLSSPTSELPALPSVIERIAGL